jgi:hypothetical protein
MHTPNNTDWQWMHVDVQIALDVPAMQKVEETHNQKTELLVCIVC